MPILQLVDGPQQCRLELYSTRHVHKLCLGFFLSVLYLKEAADVFRITGIIFVLLGVWFISQTEHVT